MIAEAGAAMMTHLPKGWMARANCRGMPADAFFPERGASTKQAKAVCAACEVRQECLIYALATRESSGIWGGLSERQRRRYIREHGRPMACLECDKLWTRPSSSLAVVCSKECRDIREKRLRAAQQARRAG